MKRKKVDLIKQAEEITRLAEIGNLCLKCSEEHDLRSRLYREIKLVLTLWRGLMEQELEENEDTNE